MDVLLQELLGSLASSNPIAQGFALIPTVIGVSSLLVKAFAKVAKITPRKSDDEFAGKLEKWVSKAVLVADYIALNPSSKDARKK